MNAFHAYDIRGVWNVDFNADTVYQIGRAIPQVLNAKTVVVGRDARLSSPVIFDKLCAGLNAAGAEVYDLGLCTTPTTYFFAGSGEFDAAVMITASHNGPEYNGLKISRKGGLPVGEDSGLDQIKNLVELRNCEIAKLRKEPKHAPQFTIHNSQFRKSEYAAFLRSNLPDISGLNVIADSSSGMASLFIKDLWKNYAVRHIYDEIDGTFVHHNPNPLLPETSAELRARVVAEGADLGVIFDGDADRVMFVDEKGNFIRPDLITAVLAEYYLAKEPGAAVLCDIRTSRSVTEHIAALGGKPHLWKVGHAFAKVKLRELNAVVGGELAGHYYFRDFFCCDSGILCAQIVMGVAAQRKREGKTFSKLIASIDKYANTGECNYTIADKAGAIEAVREWAGRACSPNAPALGRACSPNAPVLGRACSPNAPALGRACSPNAPVPGRAGFPEPPGPGRGG
ncbi:MAG: phosphomannomutase/phosphoglucomutase, partial [Kiritimatiellaeota bacterium]|nr:phosphomannomutase/phosphoglucomutase [Kiritimatiellota bacterium]